MKRILNKHKQINPVRSKTPEASADAFAHRTSNGVNTTLKPRSRTFSSLRGRPKVFVAMSGGVDSSVAAALLKERGFDVRGVHIKMWSPQGSYQLPATSYQHDAVCRQQYQDRLDAMRVAAKLAIPFETWDFTKDYKQWVVDYMVREYAAGRTPNPDVMCNKKIKFGVFLKRALEAGADYTATGHYVRKSFLPITNKTRITNIRNSEKFVIRRKINKLYTAKDENKDQSYFLWTLTQDQLKHCLFPIGDYTKPEVRTLARKYDLPTADKKDSQGLCFIGKIDVREFLKNHIPEKRGRVLTTSGKKVGEHAGLEFYTLGQRSGIGIGGGTPYYVAEKDFAANTLVVAEGSSDPGLLRKTLSAMNTNWIAGNPPKFPLRAKVRIRYRQPLQRCRVYEFNEFNQLETHQLTNSATHRLKVMFDKPQRAVTPGQSVVFYKGERLLGGSIIQ